VILVSLLLILAVLILYYPAIQNQFTNFDDNLYVTANRMVAPGLTIHGIREAFTSTTAGNWQPLTMLSLEMDAQLFGKEPAGFHLTSLILHAGSTCLLFLVFQRTTGRVWESAWVAAMFALHPLQD